MTKTKQMIYIAIMCAITAVCSQLALPSPTGIPLTFQTFAVALSGFLLGKKSGFVCYSIYLLLGICGVPVFSGLSGGISKIIGLSGGFLWGFYVIIFFSAISKNKGLTYCIITSIISVSICHFFGILQYSFISKISFTKAFLTVSAAFILKDIISCVFAYAVTKKILKAKV